QPLDHVARTLIVRTNVSEYRAQLVQTRRVVLQKKLRGLGIAQDCAKRLVQLVRECRSELSHHRDPAGVSKLSLKLLQVQLRTTLRRNIEHHTAHQDRPPSGVAFDASTRSDPSGLAARNLDAMFHVKVAAIPQRSLKGDPDGIAVFEMD